MNFELKKTFDELGDGLPNAFFLWEAFSEWDITFKRYAEEALSDLTPSGATATLVEKIRLY